jgi:N-acetylglutamate synthase-like GNAT family acetyltransferase
MGALTVRPLAEDDLEPADWIMRVAFGTFLGLADPAATFGDADYVRTRFRAAPDCAWAAELDGELVGSVFAARWGTFAFLGPLTVDPAVWDRGVGGALTEAVTGAFDRWEIDQAGLFTFPSSARHVGLYQKHGFWPRFLTAVTAKEVTASPDRCETYSQVPPLDRGATLDAVDEVTAAVFPGLDVRREIEAVEAQRLGDTLLLREGDAPAGVAVCHCGAGSEAGSGVCYVKFGAVRPGAGAGERFERLLEACESFAAASGLRTVTAGVNTGRLDAYRRMLRRGYRTATTGISMRLRPGEPDFDGPGDYVIDDLR